MFADLDAVTGADVLGMVEDVVVHQRAVGGAEILDHPTVVMSKEPGVDLGDASVVDHDRAVDARPMVVSA